MRQSDSGRGKAHNRVQEQGPVHAAGMIIREEGILGLWAGAAPTVMRNGTNQVPATFCPPGFNRPAVKQATAYLA